MLVNAERLRLRISSDEFDYQTLISALSEYSRPRDRITELLRQDIIIQVRKGLYVFNKPLAKHPISMELLANLIHGPSYVSMESALARHGLIPEHVHAVTSASMSRARRFATTLGLFVYARIPASVFSTGVERFELPDGRAFLLAGPEKALSDKVFADRGLVLRSNRAVEQYLLDSLRIDSSSLANLDGRMVSELASACGSSRVRWLGRFLEVLATGRRRP